jgi:hypothetical protein
MKLDLDELTQEAAKPPASHPPAPPAGGAPDHTEAIAFAATVRQTLSYLHERWRDEHEYEDIDDYRKHLAEKHPVAGIMFGRMSKQPFGVHFRVVETNVSYFLEDPPRLYAANGRVDLLRSEPTVTVGDLVLFGRKGGEQTRGRVTMVTARKIKIAQIGPRGRHPAGTIWTVDPGLVRPLPPGSEPREPTDEVVSPTPPKPPRNEEKAKALWNHYAQHLGLQADWFGREFVSGRMRFRVIGLTIGRRSNPVDLERVPDGKVFRCSPSLVRSGLTPKAASSDPTGPPTDLRAGDTVEYEWKTWPRFESTTIKGIVTRSQGGEVEVYSRQDMRFPKLVSAQGFTKVARRSEAEVLDELIAVYVSLSPEALTADGERRRSEVVRLRGGFERALRVLWREIGRRVTEEEAFAHADARRKAKAPVTT